MSRSRPAAIAPIALLVCDIVRQSPGIHFRGLARAARVTSAGQLRHHLDRLGRRGALIEVEDGRFKRFFVPGDHDARVRQGLTRFARRVPRLIGHLLMKRPLNRTQLRRHLGCADSTLGYHLTRMVKAGDLTRTKGPNHCLYALMDPAFVGDVLRRYGPSDGPRSPLPAPTPPSGGSMAPAGPAPNPSAPVGPPDVGPPPPPPPAPLIPFRPLGHEAPETTDPAPAA